MRPILKDFDPQVFLRDYWQKKPGVFKQVLPDFSDPLTPDELAGLALDESVDSRVVSQQNETWNIEQGPFDNYQKFGESHWSLLVQATNYHSLECQSLMDLFNFVPQWRQEDLMVSFSTPSGGVGPHLDQYDVFIIQGMGKRHWKIGDNKALNQLESTSGLLHVAPFEAMIDEVLCPGDMIYIPPGFAHEGYSLENSLNYSVGFRAPNQTELLSGFADFLIHNNIEGRRFTDPQRVLTSYPTTMSQQDVDSFRSMLLDKINEPELFEQFVTQYFSQSKHELQVEGEHLEPNELQSLLTQGTKLIKSPGVRVVINKDLVAIEGEEFILPSLDENISQLLNNSEYQLIEDCHPTPQFIELAVELVSAGFWYIED